MCRPVSEKRLAGFQQLLMRITGPNDEGGVGHCYTARRAAHARVIAGFLFAPNNYRVDVAFNARESAVVVYPPRCRCVLHITLSPWEESSQRRGSNQAEPLRRIGGIGAGRTRRTCRRC